MSIHQQLMQTILVLCYSYTLFIYRLKARVDELSHVLSHELSHVLSHELSHLMCRMNIGEINNGGYVLPIYHWLPCTRAFME
jgi:hypothetical protein